MENGSQPPAADGSRSVEDTGHDDEASQMDSRPNECAPSGVCDSAVSLDSGESQVGDDVERRTNSSTLEQDLVAENENTNDVDSINECLCPSYDSNDSNNSLSCWANSSASTVRGPGLCNSGHLSSSDVGGQENQNQVDQNEICSSSVLAESSVDHHPLEILAPEVQAAEEEYSINENMRVPICSTQRSDDNHPLEIRVPDPVHGFQGIDYMPNTIQRGNFEQLQRTLDDEAGSRNDFPLGNRNYWSGIILDDQNIICPYNGNFELGYHFTPLDGSGLGPRRKVFRCANHARDVTFITKQSNRDEYFNRCEIELAIVSGSDTIIQPIGVIWNQYTIYTFQKHFIGMTLTELLKTRHTLTDDEIHWLNYKMLLFLESIHRLQIVHRNIDTDHIIISREDLKIYVVGCSSICKRDDSMSRTPRKSLSSAPEVARGEDHTSACDMFSLGCTLHRCLSGIYPYFGDVRQQRTLENMIFDIGQGKYPLSNYLAGFEDPWCRIISRMTHHDPRSRDPADKVLRDNYQTEPPWQNWFFAPIHIDVHHRVTTFPTSPNRLDQIVSPRMVLPRDLQDVIGNIPSDDILDVEEGNENEEAAQQAVVPIPMKPVSVHSSDSGMDTARELGSSPPSGIPEYPNYSISEMSASKTLTPEENGIPDTYRICVMENERISTEVELPRTANGSHLFKAVVQKLRLSCGCVFTYQGNIIGFDKLLQLVFPQREVTVKMERISGQLSALNTTESPATEISDNQMYSFGDLPNEQSHSDDLLGSLTTQMGDEEFPLLTSPLMRDERRTVGVADFELDEDQEQDSETSEGASDQADFSEHHTHLSEQEDLQDGMEEAKKKAVEDQVSGNSYLMDSTLTDSRDEPDEAEREYAGQSEDCGVISHTPEVLDREESVLQGQYFFDAQHRSIDEETSDPEDEESEQSDVDGAQSEDRDDTIEWEIDEESEGVNQRSEEVLNEAEAAKGDTDESGAEKGSESDDSGGQIEGEDVAADQDEEDKAEGDDSGCVDPDSEQTPESSFSDANNLTDDACSPMDADKGPFGEDGSPCS